MLRWLCCVVIMLILRFLLALFITIMSLPFMPPPSCLPCQASILHSSLLHSIPPILPPYHFLRCVISFLPCSGLFCFVIAPVPPLSFAAPRPSVIHTLVLESYTHTHTHTYTPDTPPAQLLHVRPFQHSRMYIYQCGNLNGNSLLHSVCLSVHALRS